MLRSGAERNAINAPIQERADIIKIAMIRIHEKFKEQSLKSKMLLRFMMNLFLMYINQKKI